MILGASWVDNGSKQRARKATPTSRIALGTGMEATCCNIEQKALKKDIDFIWCFDKFLGRVWLTTAPQREPEKAPRAPRRAHGTGMETTCSNMEPKVKSIDFIQVFLMILGRVGLTTAPQREPEKAPRAPRRALGTDMEAKSSNMEPKAKNIDFTQVF